ncbi:MAG: hypothetical protein JWO81_2371 [Alphaproteobacteria bacterium]|nr:hypothetical protein [Alphaproteobacteria bacterium]
MTQQLSEIAVAALALAGLAIFLAASLRGWQGWLELKRLELGAARPAEARSGGMAERIELADLRERIRKLESLAACIDL